MTRRRDTLSHDRTILLLVVLVLSPLATTPPAPIFVHAEHVLVQPAPEETHPATAFARGGAPDVDAWEKP